MSFRLEEPKTHGVKEMFEWWCKGKIKFKRHMKIMGANSNSNPTRLVSKNSDELKWLREHVMVLAEQIEKLQIADKNKSYFTKDTESIYNKNREIYDANARIKHLEQVDGSVVHEVMTEKKFRDVINLFNQKTLDRLINDASAINMKSTLGFLYIQRVERTEGINGEDKCLRMPNWGESYKVKKELIEAGITPKDKDHPDGENWIVFYDDEYFIRFAWSRRNGACRVKNHGFYKFIPSKGLNGAKKQLAKANQDNKFLAFTYKIKSGYVHNAKMAQA